MVEVTDTKTVSGYGKPPWVFEGSALYQLHLVKAETARAFIPKNFRLVEAFGYTLGGFFLASYDDSPAGTFDELVVIAGIVWNPPTSCAWAARVLVNSNEACIHGRKDVGLPSQVARFSKRIVASPRRSQDKVNGFLSMMGIGVASYIPKKHMNIQVSEIKGHATNDLYNISLSSGVSEINSRKWMGPAITMSLPSFSGLTEYNPHLLKYSCRIECRVRAVKPAKVSGPYAMEIDRDSHGFREYNSDNFERKQTGETKRNLSVSLMLSKPIIALEFNCLRMKVEAPVMLRENFRNSSEDG